MTLSRFFFSSMNCYHYYFVAMDSLNCNEHYYILDWSMFFCIAKFSQSSFPFPVYWSCQFIARSSNMSMKHWQQMGGVRINEDIVIDKLIHKAINSPSSVLKVEYILPVWYIFAAWKKHVTCNLLGKTCY